MSSDSDDCEYKRYSVSKRVPRQTLWSQRQKKKKFLESEAGGSKLPGDESSQASDDPQTKATSQDHAEIPFSSSQDKIVLSDDSSSADNTGTKSVDKDPDSQQKRVLETSKQMNIIIPAAVVHPIPASAEVDSEESIKGWSSDEFISEAESSSSSDADDEDNLVQGETIDQSRIGLQKREFLDGASSSTEPTSSCPPPEVKYPMLLHMVRSKHQLCKEAVEDIADCINDLSMLGLKKKVIPSDSRRLENMFKDYMPSAEKHFVCQSCSSYVGTQVDGHENYLCSVCKVPGDFKSSEHFCYIPLSEQLRNIFENNFAEVSQCLQRRKTPTGGSHLIECIQDGAMYKSFIEKTDDNTPRISLTFNSDGVPVFASSGSSLWPILCTINELPQEIKTKHVLMPALWYGVEKKPSMNQFLLPFINECIYLNDVGFVIHHDGEDMRIKVTVLLCVADSVARPLLLNSHQFNGKFGCSMCLHAGKQVPKGRGTVMVYPHSDDVVLRTDKETRSHAKVASTLEKKPSHHFGIKGETVLSFLPGFDIIQGLVPDYLHCSILGVARQFGRLWFDSTNHGKEFYIGPATEVINCRLKTIQPPFFVSRVPRDIETRKLWKAHEWYVWVLYYSVPVLKNILPTKYLRHWMLMVEGLFLLTQESVSKAQVYNASELFVQFTLGTEKLYGIEHCSFNVHLQEHLGQSVLAWGPLWAHSAFIYEDFNQILLKTIKSSKGVLHQVVTKIGIMRSIPSLLTPYKECSSLLKMSEKTRLLSTKDSLQISNEKSSVVVLKPKKKKMSDSSRLALDSINVATESSEDYYFSDRVIINKEVYHAKSYKLVKKRNNYTVLVNDKKVFAVNKFVVVQETCFALGAYLVSDKTFKIVSDKPDLPHLIFVKKVDGTSAHAVDVSNFVTKVVFLKCDHLTVNAGCIPSNRLEVLK